MLPWETPTEWKQCVVDGYTLQITTSPGRNPWHVMLYYHNGSAVSRCATREEAEARIVEMLEHQRARDAEAFAALI